MACTSATITEPAIHGKDKQAAEVSVTKGHTCSCTYIISTYDEVDYYLFEYFLKDLTHFSTLFTFLTIIDRIPCIATSRSSTR